nr:MAG TPA: hypothetical protein [Caudoviricetes sp.]
MLTLYLYFIKMSIIKILLLLLYYITLFCLCKYIYFLLIFQQKSTL